MFQTILLAWNFGGQTPFSLICRPVAWYLELEAILRDYLSQLTLLGIKKQVQRTEVLLRYEKLVSDRTKYVNVSMPARLSAP